MNNYEAKFTGQLEETNEHCLFFYVQNPEREGKKMSKYFMNDSELQELEQLMMLVPNFSPRGRGIIVVHGFGKIDAQEKEEEVLPTLPEQFRFDLDIGCLKSNGRGASYDRFISSCFHECKSHRLQSRLEYLIRNCAGDFFISQSHRGRFGSVCRLQEIPVENRSPIHLSVLFLLSADDKLWSAAKDHVYADSFDFKKMNLSGINTDGYAIYQMTKTIYTAKEYIRLDEIADKFLIGDQAFKAIIHSILIAKYGAPVLQAKFK